MPQGLDADAARIRYGAHSAKAAQLSGLFYFLKEKRLVYRSETTTDTKALPYCAACITQVTGKLQLESCLGRCKQCAMCPFCSARLGVTGVPGEDGQCCFTCPGCSYLSAGVVQCARGESEVEDGDALVEVVLRLEKQRDTDSDFASLQAHLGDVVAEYAASAVPETTPEEAAMRRRDRELGGAGLGMHPERLRVFEAALEARQAQRTAVQHLPRTQGLAEAAAAPVRHAEDEEAAQPLPVRVPLVVRPAVRYKKQLLVSDVDVEAKRRLNRSASVLLPRLFLGGRLPEAVEAGSCLSLPLVFVNPASTPCSVLGISVVQSAHVASCRVPQGSFDIGARPETESHRCDYTDACAVEQEEAVPEVLAQWDNHLTLRMVLAVAPTLPETAAPGDGIGLTLQVDYRHTIDAEDLETPLFVFIVIPFKPLAPA